MLDLVFFKSVGILSSVIWCFSNLAYRKPLRYWLIPDTIVPEERPKIIGYYVSTIHCLYMLLFSSLYLTGNMSIGALRVWVIPSSAYFFQDMVTLIQDRHLYRKLFKSYMVHHTVVLYGWYLTRQIDNPEHLYYIIMAGLTECPLLFLNLSWFMHKFKSPRKYLLATVNFVAFVSYFLFRVVNLTVVYRYMYSNFFWSLFLPSAPLVGLNYYWFFLLCKRGLGSLFKKKIKKEE